jgi:NAD(P)-dependent dehydrogenase (short-subunit alcohol dehydrogenase family)
MLVTGAASGIGRAIVLHFVHRGWFVGIADIDRAGLAALARDLGPAHVALPLDVRDSAAWQQALGAFSDAAGARLDVFVNNAGIAHSGRFEDIPLDAALATIDTNLAAAVRGIYACLPLLKATPGAQLINMCSSSGLCGFPALAVYSATKAGLLALSQALSIELAEHGISVTALAPHFVETPLLASPFHTARSDPPARPALLQLVRVNSMAEVVAEVQRAVDKKPMRIVIGADARRVDRLQRLLPGLLRRMMRQRWQRLMGL